MDLPAGRSPGLVLEPASSQTSSSRLGHPPLPPRGPQDELNASLCPNPSLGASPTTLATHHVVEEGSAPRPLCCGTQMSTQKGSNPGPPTSRGYSHALNVSPGNFPRTGGKPDAVPTTSLIASVSRVLTSASITFLRGAEVLGFEWMRLTNFSGFCKKKKVLVSL